MSFGSVFTTPFSFIKDVPSEYSHLFEKYVAESPRATLFPNLNYSGLFFGIVNLIDVFPLMTSGHTGSTGVIHG